MTSCLFKIGLMKCMQKIRAKKLELFLKNKGESGISSCNNVYLMDIKKMKIIKQNGLVDEPSAEVVKEIFNLFIQGHGTFEIARKTRERKNINSI